MSETQSRDGLPDGWADMSQEEREAWANEHEQTLEDTADDAVSLSDDEREALNALAEPIENDTTAIELNGQTMEVRTYLDAEREDMLAEIEKHSDDLSRIRGTLADALAWLIVDDSYGGDSGKNIWRVYADRYGVASLSEVFYCAVKPALERMENSEAAKRFRGDR